MASPKTVSKNSHRRYLLIGSLLLTSACGPKKPAVIHPTTHPGSGAPQTSAGDQAAPTVEVPSSLSSYGARIELMRSQGLAKIHISAYGNDSELRDWTLPKAVQDTPIVHAADGAPKPSAQVSPPQDDGSRRMSVRGALGGELGISYTVPFAAFHPNKGGNAGLLLQGSNLLAHPSSDETRASMSNFVVSWDSNTRTKAVSDAFGPWYKPTQGTPKQLAQSWVALAGPVQRTRFVDHPGRRDSFASLGSFLFDTRWLGAEVAGIRSAVDAYFGLPHESTHHTLLYGTEPRDLGPKLEVQSTPGGLLMRLSSDASWEGAQRLALTQYMVRKNLVGIFDFSGVASSSFAKDAFEQGCARYMARSILFEKGLLSAQEYGEDLNALEAASLNPLAPDQAKQALAIRSGAAMCRRLDLHLRNMEGTSSAVKYWVHELRVKRGASSKALTPEQASQTFPGEYPAGVWSEVMVKGKPTQLDKGEVGPCLRKAKGRYKYYDLGPLVPQPAQPLGELSEFATTKVGLRSNDQFVRWELDDAQAPSKVQLEVLREGEPKRFEFTPKVLTRKGVEFQRVVKVPDVACGF